MIFIPCVVDKAKEPRLASDVNVMRTILTFSRITVAYKAFGSEKQRK